ncbi:MAG: hypothetical protein IJD10_07625 [Clostridia bacterium]|nr:hypothetical protein [Clostridia bacterium]
MAFLDKLKQIKGLPLLLIGIAAGLLLLFIGGGEEANQEPVIPDMDGEVQKTDDYLSALERRVVQLLEAMDGVSGVSVAITADATSETVYAQNGRYSGGSLTEREYLVLEQSGEDTVIPVKVLYPKLRGIAVVCRGGSNPILQEKIVSLLCALFELPANKVYVTG